MIVSFMFNSKANLGFTTKTCTGVTHDNKVLSTWEVSFFWFLVGFGLYRNMEPGKLVKIKQE